jgi:hypothetical protein
MATMLPRTLEDGKNREAILNLYEGAAFGKRLNRSRRPPPPFHGSTQPPAASRIFSRLARPPHRGGLPRRLHLHPRTTAAGVDPVAAFGDRAAATMEPVAEVLHLAPAAALLARAGSTPALRHRLHRRQIRVCAPPSVSRRRARLRRWPRRCRSGRRQGRAPRRGAE